MLSRMRFVTAAALALVAWAMPLRAADALQLSGFALLRGASHNSGPPLGDTGGNAQFQLGIDWRPSMTLGTHVHLLARDDAEGSKHGRVGIVEAYVEAKLHPGRDRVRILAGAFFLPTSRENVDALWATPYTITPSALNSWLGEEFRPIGVDVAYTLRNSLTAGATVFRGNDTLGALPAARGWEMRDHWAVLGEHLPVDGTYFSSVSAETDSRVGWAYRARWNNQWANVQYARIDNRSDAMEHGDLFNWVTRFDIASADVTINDWTVAAESGWGVTTIDVFGTRYPDDIRASYLLVSRRFGNARASLRGDAFSVENMHRHAVTAALFWYPRGNVRAGVEGIAGAGQKRAMVELRYSFAR
ncbi:MAG TPA: hypothetical protein VG323_08700 [Thermoanaerobaculia bacterium]|nr:hypothetical protein [Thermoanaerobaculia bacterium]